MARFVPVRTGIASETMIEMFGDLKDGDIVVSGPYKALRELKPGAKVKQEQPGGRPGGPQLHADRDPRPAPRLPGGQRERCTP